MGGGGGAVRGEPWDAIATAGGACFEGKEGKFYGCGR